MHIIKRILWPTDANESALRALEAAIVLAKKFSAEIHALQVVEQVPRLAQAGFAGDPVTAIDFPLYEKHLVMAARENLHETVVSMVHEPIKSEIHVEMGSPKESILAFTKSHEIDMIIMATHGREGFSHFWLGSVAEAVIRQSSVPVLAIPVKEKEQEE